MNLFFTSLDKAHLSNIKNTISKLDNTFDIILVSYDGTDLSELENNRTKIIYKEGLKWNLVKDILHPKFIDKYEYLFIWDCDVIISDNFDFNDIIKIMKNNDLKVCQPSIYKDGYTYYKQLYHKRKIIGSHVNMIEIMCPIYRKDAYLELYKVLIDENGWGWGYDIHDYGKQMVIDKYYVKHTDKATSGLNGASEQWEIFKKIHPEWKNTVHNVIRYDKVYK